MAIDVSRTLWGGPAKPTCMVTRIVSTADDHGDRIAVIDGDEEVTYTDLLAWAGRIAGLLREEGLRPGEPVGVACPRTVATVAALLGVVLGGFSYVPLDLDYPRRRLEHMLADSGTQVVLHLGDSLDLHTTATPVRIPDRRHADQDDRSWIVADDPDRPVYIIYTSGSTGWPKGVVLQHNCLDNVAEWQTTISPAPDLRTAQFAPLNFDVSFQEIFGTLCGGGTLVIMPESLRRDPVEFMAWMTHHGVERLFLPYMALQMLAAAAAYGADTSGLVLEEINVAGEQLVCTDEIRTFFDTVTHCRLVNHYGQSESAMVSSHLLTGEPANWPALPPIGHPLPGCELLIDTVDTDTPDVGELLVAGLPVSLGYLGMPDLNKTRYVNIPLTAHGHTKAFRTGDLVKLADSGVQFLTRVDDDVKLRGIRISLSEVGAQLVAQPEIAAAVAVVLHSNTGLRALHAAVVLHDPTTLWNEEDLLHRLGHVLPEVSVPLSITVLPDLPRTPSGKIDKTAVTKTIAESA